MELAEGNTQGLQAGKLLACLGTVVEEIELGLELLALHAYALFLANNGFHFVVTHLGYSQRAENVAYFGNQPCFNHLNRDLVDEPLEGDLQGARVSSRTMFSTTCICRRLTS